MNGTRSLRVLSVSLGMTACGPADSLTSAPSEIRSDVIAADVLASAGRTAGLDLSPSGITFSAVVGGADPAAQTVAVSNLGKGKLANLSAGPTSYGAGASGWLTATLSDTKTPAQLSLVAATGALAAGTYTATVPVTTPKADNSPQSLTVTFTVASAPISLTGSWGGIYTYGSMSATLVQTGSTIDGEITDALDCIWTVSGSVSGNQLALPSWTLKVAASSTCVGGSVQLLGTVDDSGDQLTGTGTSVLAGGGEFPWTFSWSRLQE